MSAVKTCPLDPANLVARCREAALRCGFREESFGHVDGVPLIAFTKRAMGPKPRIYISSGIHGDEPAPPLAMLKLLESGEFDARATWFLVPMLNPTGFAADQRENDTGIDLNRDYTSPVSAEISAHVDWLQTQPRFDVALCLHEDWEAQGFYLYELNASSGSGMAHALREAASSLMPIDPHSEIDGRPINEPGIIRPESDPALRDTWPEAIYLWRHHTDLCYTVETPSGSGLDRRVSTHVAVIKQMITETLAIVDQT
ncbi:MAG: M14 family metallocarboxypeptidase [Candidatus Synoicihabitans palmerolidicus]|nr:M14 family metallocarboxypeptidase [Candidatus Synoicihabitans palmerolidicus]